MPPNYFFDGLNFCGLLLVALFVVLCAVGWVVERVRCAAGVVTVDAERERVLGLIEEAQAEVGKGQCWEVLERLWLDVAGVTRW